jgi:transposase
MFGELLKWYPRDAMKKSESTKTTSIYRDQNALIAAVFKRAEDPRKVLCVALDYAKGKHLALICDGNGDKLKAAFPIHNNPEGIEFLIEKVSASARRRNIPANQIFFGGEDEPAYVANFTHCLRSRGYVVVRVSAWLAKKNRESSIATTDKIDLLGIAKTLLSRRARCSGDTSPDRPIYHHLRELMRTRRKLVRDQTATSNRIHTRADQLFPGFLNGAKSIISPFTKISLELMTDRFSASEFVRRRPAALARKLGSHRIQDPAAKAADLIELARTVLPPAPDRIAPLQRTLLAEVDLYRCLIRNAKALEIEAAQLLAATPYAMLTSIPGIGFVLAAGLAGELGDPHTLAPLDSLCCYSGIVPRTYQTGGEDSPATQGKVSRRCNHILKDWVVQSAQKIHLYGPPELKDRITRWNANGQHGIFAGARRYIRLVRTLTQNGIPYLAPCGRGPHASLEDRDQAARVTWEIIQRKWHKIPGGDELIIDEAQPLGFWRKVLSEAHGIHLPSKG